MNDKDQVVDKKETAVTMSTHPLDWPHFEVGETFELKGMPFVVRRVNKSGIAISPNIKGMSAAQVMWLMGRNG